MVHVLAGCKTVLTQGRYRWDHDEVLAALADIFEQERRALLMSFAEEGQKSASQNLFYRTLRDRN